MMCVILSYNSSIFFCVETIRDVNLSPCDLDSSWLQSQAVSISLLQGEGIKKALFEYIYFPWITINKLIRFFLILSGQVRSTGQYYLTVSKTFLFIKTGSCREKETWLTRTDSIWLETTSDFTWLKQEKWPETFCRLGFIDLSHMCADRRAPWGIVICDLCYSI